MKNEFSNKKFGWFFTAIFTGAFMYFNQVDYGLLSKFFLFLATIFLIVTIFAPWTLTTLNHWWFSLGRCLGGVVSPIILSVIFFILIVPVSLITRLFGRDALLLKKREVSSYWVQRQPIEIEEPFKNQF